ncbi:MAG: acyl-CoA thioesterase [candidate division KSB1 bacterium]|nr:acyl-CoA thioesterase [candidate division KSB1 bacterium]
MTFRYCATICLHHTDAAGIIFYGRLFDLAFEALSAFLQEIGFSVPYIINESDYLMPFVHAEADFLRPMRLGDEVIFEIGISRIGTSSFTVDYAVYVGDEKAASLQTTQVLIDKASGKAVPLHDVLRQGLERYALS